jgi:LL-diaminopimelate aminotransferase
MVRLNENFLKLPGGYLFPEIARRVRAFTAEKPPKPLIKLGIGA